MKGIRGIVENGYIWEGKKLIGRKSGPLELSITVRKRYHLE